MERVNTRVSNHRSSIQRQSNMNIENRMSSYDLNQSLHEARSSKASSFLKADHFGRNFKMKLNGNFYEMRSYMGAILSILYIALVLIFLMIKVATIYYKQDVDIMSTVQVRGLPNETVFGSTEGL